MNFDLGANTRLFKWLVWNLAVSDRFSAILCRAARRMISCTRQVSVSASLITGLARPRTEVHQFGYFLNIRSAAFATFFLFFSWP